MAPARSEWQFGRIYTPDDEWLANAAREPILDPELPIVDPHHHLWVRDGHRYLLDEFAKGTNGELIISRRFWFDRVGGIRLARQQIFDAKGEIESDITYGAEGNLTDTGEYTRLPLEIVVTRPEEKYSMKLTYQMPEAVTIGKKYPTTAFVLENSWGLEAVDLDKKLQESTASRPVSTATGNTNTATTRFH